MPKVVKPVAAKSVRRRLIKLAHLAVSCGLGICIVSAIGIWRLSQGPVYIENLTPFLERAMSAQVQPYSVSIERTLLVWGGWNRFIDLRVRDVRFSRPDGESVAWVPHASLGVSLSAALQGRVALSRVELHDLEVTLQRAVDGQFKTLLREAANGARRDATEGVGQLLQSMTNSPKYLRRIAVIDMRLDYVDRSADTVWHFPRASFSVDLFTPSMEGRLAFVLDFDGARTLLSGAIRLDRGNGGVAGQIQFEDLRPDLLARAARPLAALAKLGTPVSGSALFELTGDLVLTDIRLGLRSKVGAADVDVKFPPSGEAGNATVSLREVKLADLARTTPELPLPAGLDFAVTGQIGGRLARDGQLQITHVDLTAGPGRIEAPALNGGRFSLSSARLRAELATNLSKAEVHEASIVLGQTRLAAKATMRRLRDDYLVRGSVQVNDLPVQDIGRYWPVGRAPAVRQWIGRNIAAGHVRQGRVEIGFKVPQLTSAKAAVEALDGSFSYEGLSVAYWPDFPTATDIGGTAKFDARHLRLTLTDGHVRDVAIEQGTVEIASLAERGERVAIDLGLRGAAKTVAEVLDIPPLGLPSRLGIRSDAVSGEAIIRSRIGFPLAESLSEDRVSLEVSAQVRNAGLKPAPHGLAVDGGEIAIKADRDGLKMSGNVQLGALPVSVEWSERFGKLRQSREVRLSGRVRDFGDIGFGLPAFDFIAGPGDTTVVIRTSGEKASEVLAEFDLVAAELAVPLLGWRKAANVPGRATLGMRVGGAEQFVIERFGVQTSDTRLHGAAMLMEQGTWRIRVDGFERPGSRLSGMIDLRPDRSIVANMQGDTFDIAPMLAVAPPAENRLKRPAQHPRRIKLNARLGQLHWGAGRQLNDATVSLLRGAQGIEGLIAEGRTGARGRLSLKYLQGREGPLLDIQAEDFGRALGAVMPGGKLTRGTLVVRGGSRRPGGPLKGSFLAKNFMIRDLPPFARLLEASSLAGLRKMLARKGLEFEAFEGDFAYERGRLSFGRARAYGAAVGLTLSGDIDTERGRIGLAGTLALPGASGRTPGASVKALTYRMAGQSDRPRIIVEPLATPSPAFLRDLFGGGVTDRTNRGDAKRGDSAQ